MSKQSQEKIEAIYYLLTDARRLESGDATSEDFLASVKEHGEILLERELSESEVQEILENG